MSQKIVINTTPGGFILNEKGISEFLNRKGVSFVIEHGKHEITSFLVGEKQELFSSHDIDRSDPVLVEMVETFGDDIVDVNYCHLKVVEIPDGVKWVVIEEEWGEEYVAEQHRTWC
jgi:hypothetical protein